MNYGGENIKCPFYLRESEYTITCEGVETGTELATKFPSEKTKKEYQKHKCYHAKNGCALMRMLEKKYEE